MFYIQQTAAISPQSSFGNPDITSLRESVDNALRVIEPAYPGIPAGLIRRMGKAVRIGVGSALSIMPKNQEVDGIIIGTANGGMEDCIKFLNQIIQYEEGILAPGNFVQSTANAISSQLGLMKGNKCYNMTHVHRGLAFENAIIDADMFIRERPDAQVLLGAVDEISTYNFNIDFLDGWYKKMPTSNLQLYESDSPASLAGEGAAMFLVSDQQTGSLAQIKAVKTLHSEDPELVAAHLLQFLEQQLSDPGQVDLMISGENGDNRLKKYYKACEAVLSENTGISRYKHMSGEYPSASSIAVWLGCYILDRQEQPAHMVKRAGKSGRIRQILIYNNFKGLQHSFMLVSASNPD